MDRRLIIPLVCFLLPGCGFHHRLPMYLEYSRIELGMPPPADIQDNTQWGNTQRTDWGWATGIEEQARYLLGENGEVIAKGYRGQGEEGSLLLLWYKGRNRSEGEVLVPSGQMNSDADILDAIRNRYYQLWQDGTEHRVCKVFRLAENKGGLTKAKFKVQQTQMEKLFPLMKGTVWRLSRSNTKAFHILAEKRTDISLVVWTLLGWATMLLGNTY